MPEAVLAYAALFGWSFLAATIVPIASEPAVLAAIARGYSFVPIVTVATIGNYLGACTTYWLARRATELLTARKDPADVRAVRWFNRFGTPILALSWVPLVGDALVAAAGAAGTHFGWFSFWVVLGKAIRYAAVAWGAAAVLR
jgi:membrane protein YqaA with SNARE-associated domain